MRIVVAGVQGSSGIDSYTRILADALAKAGHTVLLIDRTGGAAPAPDESVEVFALPPLRQRLRRRFGPIEALAQHRALRAVAASWRADVIHATQPELAPRASAVVVTAWDPEPSIRTRYRLARRQRLLNPREEALYALSDAIAIRRAAAVVAVTENIAASLKHRNVHWIPPFLDDDAIAAPPESRTSDCVFVANNVANPVKDLPLAVETLRLARTALPNARLVLVGAGAPEALPDFCVVRGRLERDTVAAVLRSAGCCLVTSTWEEFGYGGLEALASGTPLVCPPLPAFADHGPSHGVFIAERTAQSLADAVVEAASTSTFIFPDSFRASTAIPRLLELYASIA